MDLNSSHRPKTRTQRLAEVLLRDRAERTARKATRAGNVVKIERAEFDPFGPARWRVIAGDDPGYLPKTEIGEPTADGRLNVRIVMSALKAPAPSIAPAIQDPSAWGNNARVQAVRDACRGMPARTPASVRIGAGRPRSGHCPLRPICPRNSPPNPRKTGTSDRPTRHADQCRGGLSTPARARAHTDGAHAMTAPALLSVFDGRRCAGFLLHRGPAGWEAFTADEISLGIFPTRQDAANAIPLQEERCAVPETPRCPR